MTSSRLLLVTAAAALGLLVSLPVVSYLASPSRDGDPDRRGQASSDNANPADRDLSDERDSKPRIAFWTGVAQLDREIAVFESVFWDARDTESLRRQIETMPLTGKRVLEIGTGSGLIALCCLQKGADVVATDVNPAALANARYNAEHLQVSGRLDLRLVSPNDLSAFSVVEPNERFDLIVSNPPWVDRRPETIEEHALYDQHFALLRSLVKGLRDHLEPGGRVLLAYGCVDAIHTLKRLADDQGFDVVLHDDRSLDDLPEEFLPGMLVEVIDD